jgi:hypothetical protein
MNWQESWLPIFREAFEGIQPGAEGTYFVEGSEALLPIVRGMPANEASKRIGGTLNSVAAHARHAAYFVSLMNATARNEEVVPDWDSSWSVQEVDEPAWDAIRSDLESEFRELMEHVEAGRVPRNQEEMDYMMMQLAHAAYHLGSIRQLAEVLKESARGSR